MLRPFIVTVAISASVFVAPALAVLSESTSPNPTPKRATSKFARPMSVSAECNRGARNREACGVVKQFFGALNSGQFAQACKLLGKRLRNEDRGLGCPRFLSLGFPEAMPWGILGAKQAGAGVSVLVTLGQSELDHVRMRRHRVYVALDRDRLRILDTRIIG